MALPGLPAPPSDQLDSHGRSQEPGAVLSTKRQQHPGRVGADALHATDLGEGFEGGDQGFTDEQAGRRSHRRHVHPLLGSCRESHCTNSQSPALKRPPGAGWKTGDVEDCRVLALSAFGQRCRELGPMPGSSDHIDPWAIHDDSDITMEPASAVLSALLSCSTPLTGLSLRGAQQTQCPAAFHAGTSLRTLSRCSHSWSLLLAAGQHSTSLCTPKAMADQAVGLAE
ncbi:uncharacterized protein LOC122168333 [Centrocercus urophasianus]|uniref:uncharacterized protein LOC122168333 n=1 Tax=Centrocercus urophasianus TaxID=9002 RepID=UPI001C64B4F9|nr:uncharacterized protein LOC122168333 [Centrocercus urophasianus]